jgi:hypothetical protein
MSPQQHRAMEAYRYRSYYGMTGLGVTDQQIGGAMSRAGVDLMKLGDPKLTGPAAPFLAIAGAALDIAGAITSLFGPNPNNTIASGYVNQIEADIMKPNLATWQALPASQKFYSIQQAALANFMTGWNQVLRLCQNPALGSAGVNCVGDRQRGGKWDWFAYYYTPIANDPEVIPDPVATATTNPIASSVSGAVDSTVSSISTALGGINPVWIGVGLIAAALLLVSD